MADVSGRAPKPTRTKQGTGVGAKLALEIDYYRAPAGDTPDFGALSGRDSDGPWELHFEGEAELQKVLASVAAELVEVATQAREENEDERAVGRTVWLKSIGIPSRHAAEEWWNEADNDKGLDFPFRPRSIQPGDLLAVYASGTGLVIGIVEVKSSWYPGGKHPRWPYRMNTEIVAKEPVSQGVPLASLSNEREITKSIRQKSHVRLSDAEAAAALAALGIEP
jgi:hypothetical protein